MMQRFPHLLHLQAEKAKPLAFIFLELILQQIFAGVRGRRRAKVAGAPIPRAPQPVEVALR